MLFSLHISCGFPDLLLLANITETTSLNISVASIPNPLRHTTGPPWVLQPALLQRNRLLLLGSHHTGPLIFPCKTGPMLCCKILQQLRLIVITKPWHIWLAATDTIQGLAPIFRKWES
mmetsp:Transcript_119633/g.345841  ORF Transcript_119633/g.345841 Transcript_119633/m.345841 type:complete len:118 (-) Transcript_119633:2637-2990(-)